VCQWLNALHKHHLFATGHDGTNSHDRTSTLSMQHMHEKHHTKQSTQHKHTCLPLFTRHTCSCSSQPSPTSNPWDVTFNVKVNQPILQGGICWWLLLHPNLQAGCRPLRLQLHRQ
jgi:hypothetical protein